MVARAYQPSGKSAPGALLKLAVWVVVAGVVVGVGEAFIGKYVISLLLVFPLLVGLGAGAAANRSVASGKVRAPGSAALLACLGALLGQAAVHYVEYQLWRNDVLSAMRSETETALADPATSDEERAEMAQSKPEEQLDSFMTIKYGRGGLLGYLELAAEAGVSISRAGHSSSEESEPTLTGVGVYVLWGLEFMLAAGVAFFMAFGRAKQPFCEICGTWYERTVAIAVGNGQKEPVKNLIKTVDAADWASMLAPATLGTPTKGLSSVVLVERCATCEEHEPLLSVKVIKESGKGKAQTTDRYKTLIRADEMRTIGKILGEQAAAEQAAAESQAAIAASAPEPTKDGFAPPSE